MRLRWYGREQAEYLLPHPAIVTCAAGHIVGRFRTWRGGLYGLARLSRDHRCPAGEDCPDRKDNS